MTGIVLAGGRGKRLGLDKALVQIDGEFLIRRVVKRLQTVCDRIIIVGGDLAERRSALKGLELVTPLSFIPDLYPDRGSLGGIITGLKATTSSHALVVACDMPFLNSDLLQFMIDVANGYDIIIPKVGDHYEPLHAIYSFSLIDRMANLINKGELKIIDILPVAKVRYIEAVEIERFDARHRSLFNINTAEDLLLAKEMAESERAAN